jgi:hypothetical protein
MMWGTGIERFGDHYSSAASFMQPHTDWMAIGMFLIPLMLLGVIIWLVLRSTGTLPARAALTAPVAPPTVERSTLTNTHDSSPHFAADPPTGGPPPSCRISPPFPRPSQRGGLGVSGFFSWNHRTKAGVRGMN